MCPQGAHPLNFYIFAGRTFLCRSSAQALVGPLEQHGRRVSAERAQDVHGVRHTSLRQVQAYLLGDRGWGGGDSARRFCSLSFGLLRFSSFFRLAHLFVFLCLSVFLVFCPHGGRINAECTQDVHGVRHMSTTGTNLRDEGRGGGRFCSLFFVLLLCSCFSTVFWFSTVMCFYTRVSCFYLRMVKGLTQNLLKM